ncbi:hypothetical protein PoB_001381900 [Plakobranchus ocellatus]|uniref:Uncharacterized protein n=1 Tax=Plakobranchus ocellatus TaxID=259542 RepID=A0AAV3YW62_9GAST|nr:hypothetical protein PoB_001381900 [Plakobranchus ocellatus]
MRKRGWHGKMITYFYSRLTENRRLAGFTAAVCLLFYSGSMFTPCFYREDNARETKVLTPQPGPSYLIGIFQFQAMTLFLSKTDHAARMEGSPQSSG